MRISRAVTGMLIAVMLFGCAVAIQARTQTFKSGFKFTLPDNWTLEKGKGKNEYLAMAPGKKAFVTFEVPSKKANIDAVLSDYDKQIEKLVTDLKVTSKKKPVINGLKTAMISGTAKLDGTPCQVTLVVYSGGGRYLVAFTLIPDIFYKDLAKPINDIFYSVSK